MGNICDRNKGASPPGYVQLAEYDGEDYRANPNVCVGGEIIDEINNTHNIYTIDECNI